MKDKKIIRKNPNNSLDNQGTLSTKVDLESYT